MNQLSVLKCVRCKDLIEKQDLRYDLEGQNFICKQCLGIVISSFKDKPASKKVERNRLDVDNYVCQDCVYQFNMRKGTTVKPHCGYCGSQNVMIHNLTVDTLIIESQNKLHDY